MKFFIMLCLGLLLAGCGPKHVDTKVPIAQPIQRGITETRSNYLVYEGDKPNQYLILIQGSNKSKDAQKVLGCNLTPCIPQFWGEIYFIEKFPKK